MLFQLAKIDQQFRNAFTDYLQRLAKQRGLLTEIGTNIIYEGTQNQFVRAPNLSEPVKMFAATAESTMTSAEIDEVNLDYIIGHLNNLAEQFAKQISKALIEMMDETTKATGQVVDARGQLLTNDLIIEMLSKMSIDFEHSPDGDLAIVTAPSGVAALQTLDQQLKSDAEARKKYNAMMERKRDEFREREINRSLVG